MTSKKVPCHCDKCRGGLVSKRTKRDHRNGSVVRQQSTGQKRQRTDSGLDNENSDSKKKPKADHATSFFEQAKSLFPLDKRAEAATESSWENYIANRSTAENEFPGSKKTVPKSATDEEGDDDDVEDGDTDTDSEYDPRGGELDFLYALNLIRRKMASLEKEMELGKGVLLRSFRVLSCDPCFRKEDQPRTVTTLTRVYSPTRPIYIDIRFHYHRRPRRYSTEWDYSLNFKIYSRPGTKDYKSTAYYGNGWRSIANGSYDNCGRYGKKWVKVEDASLDLGEDDVKDVYEALWGPLNVIQRDDENEQEMDRRSKMVNTVRVLMAAVGIGYTIAIDDDGQDGADNIFMLEGLSDRWFARGVRKACGFQLTKDPENEKKGLVEQEEEMNRNDYAGEDNSDEDGMSEEGDSEGDSEDF